MNRRLHLFHVGSGKCKNCVGYLSELEKYECVSWKFCMNLSSIEDGRVRWLWMEGVVASSHLGNCLMYHFFSKSIYVEKSCMGV